MGKQSDYFKNFKKENPENDINWCFDPQTRARVKSCDAQSAHELVKLSSEINRKISKHIPNTSGQKSLTNYFVFFITSVILIYRSVCVAEPRSDSKLLPPIGAYGFYVDGVPSAISGCVEVTQNKIKKLKDCDYSNDGGVTEYFCDIDIENGLYAYVNKEICRKKLKEFKTLDD